MPDYSPVTTTLVSGTVALTAAGADASGRYVVTPYDGRVSGVRITPATTLTGANTESRTLQLFNRGQTGAGSTLIASKAFVSGVNAPADDETALTLSVTASDLVVATGDVLEFVSLHIGATGLAGPEFTGSVDFQRLIA
jgi:hypothetical protein